MNKKQTNKQNKTNKQTKNLKLKLKVKQLSEQFYCRFETICLN